MKTERRQELRTNELSQQIEQIGDYVKENALVLTAVVVVAAIAVGGGFWYVNQQKKHLQDGWATLSKTAALADSGASVGVFESVALEDLSPGLTAEALLKVGDAAMASLMKPVGSDADSADVGPSDTTDWAAKAEGAYGEVVSRFPDNLTALGKAMILLGVVAEDRNDFEKARTRYKKVVDDKRFAPYPFLEQASYRLENLDSWATPVVFPPPQETVPQPPAGEADSSAASVTPTTIQPVAAEPDADSAATGTSAESAATDATPKPVAESTADPTATGATGKSPPPSAAPSAKATTAPANG
ncbi:MAG: hypothetical protein JXQ75_11190 [Phycisphaerae bacterium]|nr:hypothetical protein [Phycisphaerae bacterium]